MIHQRSPVKYFFPLNIQAREIYPGKSCSISEN